MCEIREREREGESIKMVYSDKTDIYRCIKIYIFTLAKISRENESHIKFGGKKSKKIRICDFLNLAF